MPRKSGPETPSHPAEKGATIEELMARYPSLDSIPASELASLGYELDISKKRVQRIGLKLKPVREEDAIRAEALAEKLKRVPFGKITLEVNYERSNNRPLNVQETKIFIKKLVDIHRIYLDNLVGEIIIKITPADSPLRTLLNKINSFAETGAIGELSQEVKREYPESAIFAGTESALDQVRTFMKEVFEWPSTESEINDLPESVVTGGGELILPQEGSGVLFERLERAVGTFTDLPRLKEYFLKEYNADLTEFKSLNPDTAKACEELGFEKRSHITAYLLSLFLQENELRQAAAVLQANQENPDAIIDSLRKIKGEASESLQEEGIKSAIKALTDKTGPESVNLNQKLKELKEKSRSKKQIIEGIIAYYSLPEIIAAYFSRKIKELQDFLSTGKKEKGRVQYYLDGTPSITMDADPGAISGDCTHGKPLPFDDPNILLFNVKVLNEKERHTGNIYLLETTDEEGRKTWHLDAIQIPIQIDWEETFERLIKELSQQAELKDIEVITVNDQSHLISNYERIGKTVMDYWTKNGGLEIDVNIPKVKDTDTTSGLQGNGKALVLWQKETK